MELQNLHTLADRKLRRLSRREMLLLLQEQAEKMDDLERALEQNRARYTQELQQKERLFTERLEEQKRIVMVQLEILNQRLQNDRHRHHLSDPPPAAPVPPRPIRKNIRNHCRKYKTAPRDPVRTVSRRRRKKRRAEPAGAKAELS